MDTSPPADTVRHHFASAFLVTESGKIIGQKRDDKPGIGNPGKTSPFGGSLEGDETPLQAVWREVVKEETNLKLAQDDFIHLTDEVLWRELTQEWEVGHFYYVKIKDADLQGLEVYEGQGWAYMESRDAPDLIQPWSVVTNKMFDRVSDPDF